MRRIETGELRVVGRQLLHRDRAVAARDADDGVAAILRVDPAAEAQLRADVAAWQATRDDAAVDAALDELRRVAGREDENLMPATIALAHAGGTTQEWADALREVFGEYRAPTGVSGGVGQRGVELAAVRERTRAHGRAHRGPAPPARGQARPRRPLQRRRADRRGRPRRRVRSGLPGHPLSPAQIAAAARDEDVDVVGMSILSGSHLELVPEVLDRLRGAGVDAPVVVGGIIPPEDAEVLRGKGVAAVFTPKDFQMGRIMDELVTLAERHRRNGAVPAGD